MKKLLAIFMAVLMSFSVVACSNGGDDVELSNKQGDSTAVEQNDSKETGSKNEDKEVKIGDEFEAGSYKVKINSVKLGKDYEGNPAIIINLDWTNNSEETTSYMGSMGTQVFQDGAELEMAVIEGDDADVDKMTKEVRPGTTLEGVEAAYSPTSENSIEIEIQALEETFTDKPVLIKADYPKE